MRYVIVIFCNSSRPHICINCNFYSALFVEYNVFRETLYVFLNFKLVWLSSQMYQIFSLHHRLLGETQKIASIGNLLRPIFGSCNDVTSNCSDPKDHVKSHTYNSRVLIWFKKNYQRQKAFPNFLHNQFTKLGLSWPLRNFFLKAKDFSFFLRDL